MTAGSGKVTVQSGWVMEDCLHHMETFSILNAGPLLEEARVKAIMTEKELRVPRRWTRSLGRGGLDTQRRPGQRGAKARRPGQRGAKARRPGQRGAKARRPGQRGAKARRPGQRGAKARRPGQRGRQDSAYSGIGRKGCITSCGRQPLKTMRSCRNNPSTGFWIPLIWLTAAGCGMQGRMTEVAVLVSPQSLHAAEAAQPHRH
eukprot:jgi/Tetstr1/436437/TSEL_025266.t1